jgi:hypothetical protein
MAAPVVITALVAADAVFVLAFVFWFTRKP